MNASAADSPAARHRARRAAVQALYQWQMTGQDATEIETQFLGRRELARADDAFFHSLLDAVAGTAAELDRRFAPLLDRPVEQLDPVERAILRIGVFELSERPDIPARVVISEAVRLARIFGADQSYKYVNGVLDRFARDARSAEFEPRPRAGA